MSYSPRMLFVVAGMCWFTITELWHERPNPHAPHSDPSPQCCTSITAPTSGSLHR